MLEWRAVGRRPIRAPVDADHVTVDRNHINGHHVVMDLPDDLALPLERGAPWWYWSGGRPAIDLVNTLRERWGGRGATPGTRGEPRVPGEALGECLARAESLDAPPPVPPGLLIRARELREHIDAGLTAVI